MTKRPFLTKSLKEVVGELKVDLSSVELTLPMFMMWVSEYEPTIEEYLQSCSTSFTELNNAGVGKTLDASYGLNETFNTWLRCNKFMQKLHELTGITYSNPSFKFHFWLGLVVRNTSWWEANHEIIKKESNKNKKNLKLVRGINEG
jgi:hypothetical protein